LANLAEVQAKLNSLGANPALSVDGANGPKTIAAVKAFQNAKGLVVDGVIGPATLSALGLSAITTTLMPSNLPAGEVPNKMTVLTAAQAAKAISDGYLYVTGKRPNAITLALLLGQSALETGNWKSIHNYNFGNKKASGSDRNWQYFRCSEIVGGKEIFYDPPAPECKFSAYGSAAEGAAAYIKLLQSRPHWWSGLQSGTVDGFIKGLTTKPAYFTANPITYSKTLTDRMNNYSALAKQYAGSPVVIGTAIAAVAAALIGLYLFKRVA
jgi:hypothetical protein